MTNKVDKFDEKVTPIPDAVLTYIESQLNTNPNCAVNFALPMIARIRAQDAEIERLKLEIDVLRSYGNKDCTAMADEVLEERLYELEYGCQHNWIDVRNSVIKSGSWCDKCDAIKAENTPQEGE